MDNLTAPTPEDDTARLQAAYARADAKLAALKQPKQPTAPTAAPASSPGLIERYVDIKKSELGGMAAAVFETKDFLVGEPAEADKSGLRKSLEGMTRDLNAKSPVNALTSSINQMAVGLIGAGKVLAPLKVLKEGKAAIAAGEVIKGAMAGAVVIDPHEERLSDFIESYPALQNPVTEYLSADPTDSAAEGRFKNMLEGIGVDLALVGVVKAVKLLRAGDQAGAAKEIKRLEASQTPAPEAVTVPRAEAQPEAGTIEQLDTKPPIGKDGQTLIPTAKEAPKVVQTGPIKDEELDAIIKGVEQDQAAVKKYGTRTEAEAQGHKFATAQLPWQKLRVAGGAQALVERTTQVLVKRFDAAKGGSILKDKRVEAVANEYADLYGEDPALVLGRIAEAGAGAAESVSRMEAGLRIGNKMFLDADKLRRSISLGNFDEFGGNEALAKSELTSRLSLAFETLANANSIRSNAGRTLRRSKTEFRVTPKQLAAINSLDPDKLLVIMDKAGGDLKKVAMLMDETFAKRVMNEATWHMTNGLLWMWPTHLVNTTTSAFMMVARPSEKLFGSTALRLLTKDPERKAELSSLSRQALREYTYTVTALADGWSNAVEAFKQGDSILNPHNTEFFDEGITGVKAGAIQWKPWNSVLDLAENAWKAASYRNIVGLPTRSLGAADEFFKTLRYRAVVQSKAALDASDRGLTGDAYKQYVQKSLDLAIDPASGKALDANAIREAQMSTFQQDLNYETYTGSLGRGLQNLRRTAPITSLILPFLKTPINVLRYGVKLTPGLNMLQKEFTDALFGKVGTDAQAQAVGQMAMGSMFMGLAAHLAINDRFTGSGPDDYKLKQELIATGWKPYSIKWQGEDGTTHYFQLGRFDPVGMAMGMVSDIVALRKKDPDANIDGLVLAAGTAVSKNLGEKTFLLNLNSAMEAFLDPENMLPKWLGRTAGSMIPGSSLLRGHNPDPYLREARGFVDSAMRGVPGYSETLPMSMDVWGDPIERYVGISDTQENDLVEAEHNRIMLQTDKGIGKPSFKFEGVDLRDITLQDGKNAYQRLQELSGHLPNGAPSLKTVIGKLISQEAYQDLPDGDSDVKGTRLNIIGQKVQEYREKAKKVLLRDYPELRPLVQARQRETRGAILENRQQRQTPLAQVMDALTPR